MELQYKTFSSVMASVEEDLKQYADNNLISRRNYIKVAKRINSDLGPKINRKREVCISVRDYKAEVPIDLLSVICMVATTIDTFGTLHPAIHGTRLVTNTTEELVDKGFTPTVSAARLTCSGSCTFITKITSSTEVQYNSFYKLAPSASSLSFFQNSSPNVSWESQYTLSMNESEMTFNFKEGEIYISYIANMVDEEGNLLVLDHDLVNEYYEFAIKERILYDLWINGEDTYNKYVDTRDVQLPKARQVGRRIVHTPEYKTMCEHNNKILREFYDTFYKMLV